jgi:bacterioferritin
VQALGHEISAVQQYLAQASLAELWADNAHSRQFRSDGLEELGHVEKLMHRLLELGIAPPNLTGPPIRLGRSIEEMLLIDRHLEVDVVRYYEQARRYCDRSGDGETEKLFAELLEDELEHLAHIDVELGSLQAVEPAASSA